MMAVAAFGGPGAQMAKGRGGRSGPGGIKPFNEGTEASTGANTLLLEGLQSGIADTATAPMQQAAQALQ